MSYKHIKIPSQVSGKSVAEWLRGVSDERLRQVVRQVYYECQRRGMSHLFADVTEH